MPKKSTEGIQVSVSPLFFKRLGIGTTAVGGSVGATYLANSGLDGGALKGMISAVEKGGPGVIVFLVVALIFIWNSWAEDRKKHEQRDHEAAKTLNQALARNVDRRQLKEVLEETFERYLVGGPKKGKRRGNS